MVGRASTYSECHVTLLRANKSLCNGPWTGSQKALSRGREEASVRAMALHGSGCLRGSVFEGQQHHRPHCTRGKLSCYAFSGYTRQCPGGQRTYERVLRYPSGQVRRIRYPITDEEDTWPGDATSSYAEGWDPDRWDSLDIIQPTGQVIRTERSSSTRSSTATPVEKEQADEKVSSLPRSPAELLRHIQSDGYKQAQREQAQRVQSSFEILEGSPWLQSRPVFVLATQQRDSDQGLTYTLRVRVSKPEAESEISRVLGKKRPDGSALLSVSELRDGIVTFEDPDDAERYGNLLEAEGRLEVLVARVDSHELFRASQGVRSVVVLLRKGCHLPLPEQLSSALRSKRSLEDGLEDF
ncbi:g10853 [Coccomyxa viridis]|uniref:G10853 protein n=1 Tax=Coccomyxa viridis TaxID=1274662 RepID=A0ABP1G6F9_9CHLO